MILFSDEIAKQPPNELVKKNSSRMKMQHVRRRAYRGRRQIASRCYHCGRGVKSGISFARGPFVGGKMHGDQICPGSASCRVAQQREPCSCVRACAARWPSPLLTLELHVHRPDECHAACHRHRETCTHAWQRQRPCLSSRRPYVIVPARG